jgi:hypothetical protein
MPRTADWRLDDSANTVYLCATVTGQARWRPLFVTSSTRSPASS